MPLAKEKIGMNKGEREREKKGKFVRLKRNIKKLVIFYVKNAFMD